MSTSNQFVWNFEEGTLNKFTYLQEDGRFEDIASEILDNTNLSTVFVDEVRGIMSDYDYNEDMKYCDEMYYKTITSYQTYLKDLEKWNELVEMTEDDLKKLIAAIVSVVAVIAGILIPIIANAITNKKIAQKKE